ncbi:MAG: winged helix-turn-helix domain-containing protein [Candidatus Competibacteraceae bacterium]|nr:winged helix-turn-helix domain-containing protein [Candidatus Competibacteraceae bacterium]
MADEMPGRRGLGFALWNRPAVMESIKRLFGVTKPIRTVGEYLLRWGHISQRPLKRALEQRPAEVRRWLEETCPAIVARAKAEKALIKSSLIAIRNQINLLGNQIVCRDLMR